MRIFKVCLGVAILLAIVGGWFYVQIEMYGLKMVLGAWAFFIGLYLLFIFAIWLIEK